MNKLLRTLWVRKVLAPFTRPAQPHRLAWTRLGLERLEDRVTPAQITYVWTNTDQNGLWSDNLNWTNGGPSTLGVNNTAVLQFNSGTALATPPMTDDLANSYKVDEIHFAVVGGATSVNYTINGTNTIALGSAAGIVIDSGYGAGTPQVTFGSGITINQNVASKITNSDASTSLILNGAVTLGGNALTINGSAFVNNFSPNRSVAMKGSISGAGGLALNGMVTLAGANSYTGGTALSFTAVVNVTNNSGLGDAGATTTLSGGALVLDGVSVTQANLAFVAANAHLYGAGPNGGPGGAAVWNGAITLPDINNGAEFLGTIQNGTQLQINGGITGGPTGGNTSTLFALSFGNGDASAGAGVVEFMQNNTYFGATEVGDSAAFPETLQIDTPGGLGAGGGGNGTSVDNASTLLLTYASGQGLQDASANAEQLTLAGTGANGLGALQTLTAAAIPGAVTLAGDTTIGVGQGVLTFGAPIGESTPSNLTITESSAFGGGTVVFVSSNTYSGTTTVTGGTLEVDGHESGAFTIAPASGLAAALVGSGFVGAVTLNTSTGGTATLSPGVGFNTGFLNASSVTLDAGSTFKPQLDEATLGSGYSQLDCNGPLNLNGALLAIGLGGVFVPNTTTFTIVQASQIIGTFGDAPTDGTIVSANGSQFRINYTATKVTATVLNNPTSQNYTVDVTQPNQVFTLSLVVQYAPGTTGVSGMVRFMDANGNVLATVPLNFNPATAQGIGTADVMLSAGMRALSVGTMETVTGFVFGPYLPPPDGGDQLPPPSPTVAVNPLALPAPQVGVFYSQTIIAVGSNAPYTFDVSSGQLPTGLLFSNGVLSGTPTAGGPFSFTIRATDSSSAPVIGIQNYTFTVAAANIVLSPTALPTLQVGDSFSQTFAASGGTGPYFFNVTNGALPAGLALSITGVLSGTLTTAGPASFTVTARDSSTGLGAPYFKSIPFTLNVTPPHVDLTPSLPAPQVGVGYSQTITASGGKGPYTFNLLSGQLPTGLSFSNGVLSGTPTAGGPFSFRIQATDSSSTPVIGSQPYSFTVADATIVLSPTVLPVAQVGAAYSQTITASGGTASYFYIVTNGAPPAGLSLSPTGVLSGTPTTAGPVTFTVTATDSSTGLGAPYFKSIPFTLNVNPSGVSLSPTSLPQARLGAAFSQNITFSGGQGPYTFKIANGALPAGLSLSTAGLLSGTPTAGGSFSFTVKGTDSSGVPLSASITYALTVAIPTSVVVLKADDSLVQYNAAGGLDVLSPAGTIVAVSEVVDGSGAADVFVITATGNNLWEHSPSGWSWLSTGYFGQISAATNAAGQAVVFGILSDNSLWEKDPSRGAGRDAGWLEASGGASSAVIAVGTSAGAVAYGIIGPADPANAGTLWRYSAGNNTWAEQSTGNFGQISAGFNTKGQTIVFAVLGNGQLWEQDPANGTGVDVGWMRVGTGTVQSVSASGTSGDAVFIDSAQHLELFTPSGGLSLLSDGSFKSAAAGRSSTGADEVFAVLSDSSLWWYDSAFANPWDNLLASGVAADAAPQRL